ncbi:tetratricopeptide repeat protein [Nocardia cyriacigeorgica]|uniref:Tetratricopeptide repeat protein n=1 Tax=Nocardia cyriacigeorgica TaxID=135487 RepID=A0A6P1CYX1_9NOCA|nr:tetratricopeptide repeat protein [Nocardia cyriacigeorgica]NEW37734.1 tetratricopeptide repeat protein [Nocardia cyriacigeorgica]NEW43326.1 tetratricopeptide repeat protein [Nocardia cyriacigeorgica]NEW56116.1 tetratricopeptide repeat protein [Nocardia cyriacigeorgica]
MTGRTPPRSPVVRAAPSTGFLQRFGGGGALAGAVLLGLVINIVSSLFLERGIGLLISVALLTIGVGVVVFLIVRWMVVERRRLRESPYTARELELLAHIDDARTPIGVTTCAPQPVNVSDDIGSIEAKVLGALPVHEYTAAALLEVLTAMLDAPTRIPSAEEPVSRTAPLLLADLEGEGYIQAVGVQQYRVVTVPDTGTATDIRHRVQWKAAVTALARHHADQAERWAIGLGTARFAPAARRWFEAEEPFLRRLVIGCASFVDDLPRPATPSLIRITDALDVWHARTRDADAELATTLLPLLHDPDLFGAHAAQVMLRAGIEPPPPSPRNGDNGRYADFAARREHAKVLRELPDPSPAADPARLEQAREDLERVWWMLPREDIPGEVCALVNLGVVLLRQGRLDDAHDRVELAEALTRQGRDPGGRAHMHEVLGHVWWARGEGTRALRCWRLSLTAHRSLCDDHAVARCLQHLATAVIVDPRCADDVLGPNPQRSTRAAVKEATGWLAHALRLSPGAQTADGYVLQAIRQFGVAPRTSINQWPLPLEEHVDSNE